MWGGVCFYVNHTKRFSQVYIYNTIQNFNFVVSRTFPQARMQDLCPAGLLIPCSCIDLFIKVHGQDRRGLHRYICSNATVQLPCWKQEQVIQENLHHNRMAQTVSLRPRSIGKWVIERKWNICPTSCVTKSTTDGMAITAYHQSNWVGQNQMLM